MAVPDRKLQDLKFIIHGDEVSPETVDVEQLAKLLLYLRSAIAGVASVDGATKKDVFIAFLSTGKGSNELDLKASAAGVRGMFRLTEFVTKKRIDRLPKQSQIALAGMSELGNRNNWSDFEARGGSSRSRFTITADPKRPTYGGETTIFGRCLKVGGRRPTATLVTAGQLVTAKLANVEMAKEVATHLYQIIGLEGEATWYIDDDTLHGFEATALNPYRDRNEDKSPKNLLSTIEELRKLSHGRWDDVDPEAFVKELRADD